MAKASMTAREVAAALKTSAAVPSQFCGEAASASTLRLAEGNPAAAIARGADGALVEGRADGGAAVGARRPAPGTGVAVGAAIPGLRRTGGDDEAGDEEGSEKCLHGCSPAA